MPGGKAVITITPTAFVTFSDGTTGVAQASFTAPHSVV